MEDREIRIEVVIWIDSKIEIGEFDYGEEFEYATMKSVGFVVFENELIVTLAQDSREDEDTYRTTITIPKKCVIDRNVVYIIPSVTEV